MRRLVVILPKIQSHCTVRRKACSIAEHIRLDRCNPTIIGAKIEAHYFALTVDGSVIDSRRTLMLIAKVVAVCDFGYSGLRDDEKLSAFLELEAAIWGCGSFA